LFDWEKEAGHSQKQAVFKACVRVCWDCPLQESATSAWARGVASALIGVCSVSSFAGGHACVTHALQDVIGAYECAQGESRRMMLRARDAGSMIVTPEWRVSVARARCLRWLAVSSGPSLVLKKSGGRSGRTQVFWRNSIVTRNVRLLAFFNAHLYRTYGPRNGRADF
jgi:hypothetical protein